MDSLRSARWEMIEAGGRTAQSFGLNRLLGQLYMVLYLSNSPLSLDDLVEQLGVSKASVSIACRQLASWGALRLVWIKGDRKDYYSAEHDFSQMLNNGLMASINKKLDSAKIQIERSLDMVKQSTGDHSSVQFFAERLQQADQYRQKISRLINNPLVRTLIR